jgi:ABC-type uncharacterized transport system fused permease/ATPase subunit
VAYPAAIEEVSDDEVIAALTDAGLEHLVDKIHAEGIPWERTLSGASSSASPSRSSSSSARTWW